MRLGAAASSSSSPLPLPQPAARTRTPEETACLAVGSATDDGDCGRAADSLAAAAEERRTLEWLAIRLAASFCCSVGVGVGVWVRTGVMIKPGRCLLTAAKRANAPSPVVADEQPAAG